MREMEVSKHFWILVEGIEYVEYETRKHISSNPYTSFPKVFEI